MLRAVTLCMQCGGRGYDPQSHNPRPRVGRSRLHYAVCAALGRIGRAASDGVAVMLITAAGVYQITADEYHADPCIAPALSSTLAKVLLAQSPAHAWVKSPRLNPDYEPTDSKTFDIGRAAHREVLGKGGDYVAIPDAILASNGAASTTAARQFIADARADGKTPLKTHEVDQIGAMGAAARAHLAGMGVTFDPARSELVAAAQIDGIWCRAMLDNVPLDPRQPIYDFKTCESASPEACMRAVVNYGYDVQAAHYAACWKAATGEDRGFRFVFEEKQAPHAICVIELGSDSMAMARKRIARAREIWRICLEQNQWPSYPAGVHRIELPEWYHAAWLDRESAEFDHKQRTGRDAIVAAMHWQSPEGFRGAAE